MIPGIVAGTPVDVAWTPAALTPHVWLDDSTGVTDVSGAASQWDDKSGNGLHFTQSTAGARPTILAAELNGRRVLRFDGTSDFMACPAAGALNLFRNTNKGWLFAVYKKRTADVGASERTIFRSFTASGIVAARFVVNAGGPSAANAPTARMRRLDADSLATLSGSSPHSGAWSALLVEVDWQTGGCSIFVDGSLEGSNPSLTSSGVTSNTASSRAPVIATSDPASPAAFGDIDLACLILGQGSLPGSVGRGNLFAWAADRYGL